MISLIKCKLRWLVHSLFRYSLILKIYPGYSLEITIPRDFNGKGKRETRNEIVTPLSMHVWGMFTGHRKYLPWMTSPFRGFAKRKVTAPPLFLTLQASFQYCRVCKSYLCSTLRCGLLSFLESCTTQNDTLLFSNRSLLLHGHIHLLSSLCSVVFNLSHLLQCRQNQNLLITTYSWYLNCISFFQDITTDRQLVPLILIKWIKCPY